MIFISVNTPTKTFGVGAGRAANLEFVEKCARQIADVSKGHKIVVEKSTLTGSHRRSRQDDSVQLQQQRRHSMCSAIRSFLAEGTAIEDLLDPDRILIGGENAAAIQALVDVYANWVPRDRLLTTNLWSSELSKADRQRVSGTTCFFDQRDFGALRSNRGGCGRGRRGDRNGFQNRPQVPQGLRRIWRQLFSERHSEPGLPVRVFWAPGSRRVLGTSRSHERLPENNDSSTEWCAPVQHGVGQKDRVSGASRSKKTPTILANPPRSTFVATCCLEKAHLSIYDPRVSEDQIISDLEAVFRKPMASSSESKKQLIRDHVEVVGSCQRGRGKCPCHCRSD